MSGRAVVIKSETARRAQPGVLVPRDEGESVEAAGCGAVWCCAACGEKKLKQNLNQVGYYLTENGIGFYLEAGLIAPEEAGQTVGCLAGYPGFSAKEAPISPAPETECLLMSSFADKQVDQLLAALRQEKISISLKALTTPTNQKWTVVQLLEHLEEERRAYQAQREKRG